MGDVGARLVESPCRPFHGTQSVYDDVRGETICPIEIQLRACKPMVKVDGHRRLSVVDDTEEIQNERMVANPEATSKRVPRDGR